MDVIVVVAVLGAAVSVIGWVRRRWRRAPVDPVAVEADRIVAVAVRTGAARWPAEPEHARVVVTRVGDDFMVHASGGGPQGVTLPADALRAHLVTLLRDLLQ